jgi:hypothetical protein
MNPRETGGFFVPGLVESFTGAEPASEHLPRIEHMSKRELIEPNPGDKRYVRRDDKGRFKEVEDVGRASAQDQKREARSASTPGQGDRGDRKH